MGSSYRQDLNGGRMKDWETKIRQAATLVDEVRSELLEWSSDGDQTDNASDDGALSERLGIVESLLLDEVPKTKE